MVDYEVMHIAIAPPANPDANLVRSVAAVINKSPYDTRLHSRGENTNFSRGRDYEVQD